MRKMVAAAICAATVAIAEPGPTVNWLMNTPTTLFDRGMDALQVRANQARDFVKDQLHGEQTIIHSTTKYLFKENEILITLYVNYAETIATAERCKEARDFFQQYLIFWFPGVDSKKPVIDKSAADTLDELFAHNGYAEIQRDKDLGAKLIPITFVETIVRGKDKTYSSCKGRINETDPSYRSKPPDSTG